MNETSAKQTSKMDGSTTPAQPAEPVSKRKRLANQTRRVWAIIYLAITKFFKIDGAQWAGTFAFNAFFSLFPLIILSVTIASAFFDRDRAGQEVIAYLEGYFPISGEMQHNIFDTITGVIRARGQASVVAFLMLGWAAIQFFNALISSTNRAWGVKAYNWWRQPLKSLVLLAIMVSTVLLGVAVPMLAKMGKNWLFPVNDFSSWVYTLCELFYTLVSCISQS